MQKTSKVDMAKVKKPKAIETGPTLLRAFEPTKSGNSSHAVTILKVTISHYFEINVFFDFIHHI